MEIYSTSLWIVSLALKAILILRAIQGRVFNLFPLFYSYIIYTFAASLLLFPVYWLRPQRYATSYWLYYLVLLLAEFAVLMEISDHIFEPFPAIRGLGRLITVGTSALFFLIYVLPSMLRAGSSSPALLDFALRTSLTKGVIVAALVVAAWYYRLPMPRRIRGLVLGFALYLGVYITTYAAAETFGRALYANVLRTIPPFAYTLCLLVWTISMWKFERQPERILEPGVAADRNQEALNDQLAELNRLLTRLLQK